MGVKELFPSSNTVLQGGVSMTQNATQTLIGGVSFTELSAVTTDYGRATKNEAIMAKLGMPYYDIDTGDRIMPRPNDYLCGFMTSGFGWSVQNNYEDLLPVTGIQSQVNKYMQGGGAVLNAMGINLPNMGNFDANRATGQTMLSLQQTIAIWLGMQKPTFSIGMLFFDGRGDESTSVTTAAYIIERALYPFVDGLGQSGTFNLTMQAPGKYIPATRNQNAQGNPNKIFGMSAEGLSKLHIGTFASFPEIICTGASFQFSDKMLNNGKPQWLNVTFNFTMWRQPTLADLVYRYQ